VFTVVYFVIDSARKVLDTTPQAVGGYNDGLTRSPHYEFVLYMSNKECTKFKGM